MSTRTGSTAYAKAALRGAADSCPVWLHQKWGVCGTKSTPSRPSRTSASKNAASGTRLYGPLEPKRGQVALMAYLISPGYPFSHSSNHT